MPAKIAPRSGSLRPPSAWSRISLPIAVLVGLHLFVLIRTAWVCDDAYITFRAIDNFIHGHGLRWNVQDRVQVFTHPLWMLLIAIGYFMTREMFFTSIIVSIAIAVLTVAILVRRAAGSQAATILVLAILISSKAYVDYSTSGLENALTHALIVLFLGLLFRSPMSHGSLLRLSIVAGLGVLNRMDLLAFYAPVLVTGLLQLRTSRAFLLTGAGFVPFLAWEVLSLVYYGFLWPNTAYAKLSTGIESTALLHQGLIYLLDSLQVDPITLLLVAAGVVSAVLIRERRGLAVASGSLLYLTYVVAIGGDFMSGRFLTVPFLASAFLLSRALVARAPSRIILAAVAIGLAGLFLPASPLRSGADFGAAGFRIYEGIEDARAYYYPTASLLNARWGTPMPSRDLARIGRGMRQRMEALPEGRYAYTSRSSIGFFGFFCGPKVHIIDQYGLADPLLARLPVPSPTGWRIGHFKRELPPGYSETLGSGENRIADPDLAVYYDALSSVVRGPLLDRARLGHVWKLNVGAMDARLSAYATRARKAGPGAPEKQPGSPRMGRR